MFIKAGAIIPMYPEMLYDGQKPFDPVTLDSKALAEIVAPAGMAARQALDRVKADFAAATEGWYYDATDRKGVLHVKVAPRKLASGFTVVVGP